MTLLPEGFGLDLDRSVHTFGEGTVLAGGHPGRIMTLSDEGVAELAALVAGTPASERARQLGGRLVEAGMAHPRWEGSAAHPRWEGDAAHPRWEEGPGSEHRRLTVVVPARDRSDSLDRCLASLGATAPLVVVDDGSVRPDSIAKVCASHNAVLVTRPVNGGPAAARNDGLAVVDTELVAFVDSDCTVTEGWLEPLLRHFDDPKIAAVAPRIRPCGDRRGGSGSTLDRYTEVRSALDMGAEPSEVGPDFRVRYVPSAALVVRTAALADGFATGLRVGEDVDLVWRLVADGWRVRYEPSSTVHHAEPGTWSRLLARRFRYGTSAAPLASRHRGRLAPVELRPWPTATLAALLLGRPRLALAIGVASVVQLASALSGRQIPLRQPVRWSAQGVGWTFAGIGRALTMLAAPVLVAATCRSRRWAAVVGLLVLTPPAVEWWQKRPALDPVRWTAGSLMDDLAYGAGVWSGCLTSRSAAPLLPRVRWPRRSRPSS